MRCIRSTDTSRAACVNDRLSTPSAGALVSDLRASDGSAAAGDALRRADEYLGQQGEDRIVQDRSIINTGGEQSADVHSCRASEKGNSVSCSPSHTPIYPK